MNKIKKAIAVAAISVIALTGCATTVPGPTETVYIEPDNNSSNNSSTDTRSEFILYMSVIGTPAWILNDDDMVDILVNQAKNTCGFIKDGMSKDDIIMALSVAAYESGADDVVIEAIVGASVASTYSYCPQYEGFFK
jgi:hypothetical protein